ncbi:hypothetical protein V6Z11_A13G054200 [Gossypium hirsutum]
MPRSKGENPKKWRKRSTTPLVIPRKSILTLERDSEELLGFSRRRNTLMEAEYKGNRR